MLVRQVRFYILLGMVFLLAYLVLGVLRSIPPSSRSSEISRLQKENDEIRQNNFDLAAKIRQVHNNGHIVQQYWRYHNRYVAKNEVFYSVNGW